jgi:hypothetical protein
MNIWQMFGWRRKRAVAVAEMLDGSVGSSEPNKAWSANRGEARPLSLELLRHEVQRLRQTQAEAFARDPDLVRRWNEYKAKTVTPKRLEVPGPKAGSEVEVKCAWCNAVQKACLPTGTMPLEIKCTECELRCLVHASGITQIVPSDSVMRQLSRGDVV